VTNPLRWRHAGNGLLLVGILTVAGLVLHSAPDRDLQQSAIPVQGALGESASGRNIRATVHSVAVTESVTAGNGWAGTTPGIWVVADVTVEAVVDDQGATLGTAVLRIGDLVYTASTRPQTATVAGRGLATGIPLTGPLMFEVPADVVSSATSGSSTIELAVASDPRVDSLLVVPVDLAELPAQPAIEVDFPEWDAR